MGKSTQICHPDCPYYVDMDGGDVMCRKESPRMIREQFIKTVFYGWCKKETAPNAVATEAE